MHLRLHTLELVDLSFFVASSTIRYPLAEAYRRSESWTWSADGAVYLDRPPCSAVSLTRLLASEQPTTEAFPTNLEQLASTQPRISATSAYVYHHSIGKSISISSITAFLDTHTQGSASDEQIDTRTAQVSWSFQLQVITSRVFARTRSTDEHLEPDERSSA